MNISIDEIKATTEKAELSLRKKFKKSIWCKFTKSINEYDLVQPNDKIAVCISGGKDSMLMAKLFQELKRHDKFPFEVVFLVMDPGYNEENRRRIEENAAKLSVPVNIFESDIFGSVVHIEKNPCYICARMRRGYLYSKAKELGCNKIALGHHFEQQGAKVKYDLCWFDKYGKDMDNKFDRSYVLHHAFPKMKVRRATKFEVWIYRHFF